MGVCSVKWSDKDYAEFYKGMAGNGMDVGEGEELLSNSKRIPCSVNTPQKMFDMLLQNKKERGITHFGRYTVSLLKKNIEKISEKDIEKKHAVAIVADWDPNNSSVASKLNDFVRHGYNLSFYEVEKDDDFYSKIKSAGNRDLIDLLYVRGHGDPDSIRLGSETPEGLLDKSDKRKLVILYYKPNYIPFAFQPDARVLLDSGAAAAVRPSKMNIGYHLADWLGIKYLYGCEEDCSFSSIIWGKDNIVRGFKYYGSESERDRVSNTVTRYDEQLVNVSPDARTWFIDNIFDKTKKYEASGNYYLIEDSIKLLAEIRPSFEAFSDFLKDIDEPYRDIAASEIRAAIPKQLTKKQIIALVTAKLKLSPKVDPKAQKLINEIKRRAAKMSSSSKLTGNELLECLKANEEKLSSYARSEKFDNVSEGASFFGYLCSLSDGQGKGGKDGYGHTRFWENKDAFMNAMQPNLALIHNDKRWKFSNYLGENYGKKGDVENNRILRLAKENWPSPLAFADVIGSMPADERLEAIKVVFDMVAKKARMEDVLKELPIGKAEDGSARPKFCSRASLIAGQCE